MRSPLIAGLALLGSALWLIAAGVSQSPAKESGATPASQARPAAAPQTAPYLMPIDIQLRGVLWQSLPMDVVSVSVGPDRRIWYELQRPGEIIIQTHEHQEEVIREFKKPAPQLHDARPAC